MITIIILITWCYLLHRNVSITQEYMYYIRTLNYKSIDSTKNIIRVDISVYVLPSKAINVVV